MISFFEYALGRVQALRKTGLRTLVITSCTSNKRMPPRGVRGLSEAELFVPVGPSSERLQELARYRYRAEELYTGLQHLRIMAGVAAYRESRIGTLSLRIMSAGFGLVHGSTMLPPYGATFVGESRDRVIELGKLLQIPEAMSRVLKQPDDLKIIALGRDYLQAAQVSWRFQRISGLTVLLCAPTSVKEINTSRFENLLIVPLGLAEAKRYKCNLLSLKGELAARLLKAAAVAPEPKELCEWA